MARIPTVGSQGAKAYKNVAGSDGQTRFMNVAQVDTSAGSRQQGEIWSNALSKVADSATKWQEGEDTRKLVEYEGKLNKLNSYLLEDPDFGGLGTLSGEDALKKINGGWSRELDQQGKNGVEATKYAMSVDEFTKAGFTYDNNKSLTENYQENVKRLQETASKDMALSGSDALNQYTEKFTNNFVSNVNKFQDVAYKAKNELIFTGRMAEHIDKGTLQWHNGVALDATLSNVETLVRNKDIGIAAQKGVTDKDTITKLVNENKAAVIDAAIQQAMATGNTQAAKDLLKKYSGAGNPINGEQLTKLTKLVKDSSIQVDGANAVNALLAEKGPGDTQKYMKKNAAGNLDLYDEVGLRQALYKKFSNQPDKLAAAEKHLGYLLEINKAKVTEDEVIAIKEVNNLLSENKPIPPALASRLPENYNVPAKMASYSKNNETVTDMSAHEAKGGQQNTQLNSEGVPYDQVLTEMLAKPSSIPFVLQQFEGPEGEKALRGMLSARDYEAISQKIETERGKLEVAEAARKGFQLTDLSKMLKNTFQISDSRISKLVTSDLLVNEYNQFFLDHLRRKGVAPTQDQTKRFIAPYLLELATDKSFLGNPKDFKAVARTANDETALATLSSEEGVLNDSKKNNRLVQSMFGVDETTLTAIREDLDSRDLEYTLTNINALITTNPAYSGSQADGTRLDPQILLTDSGYSMAKNIASGQGGMKKVYEDFQLGNIFGNANQNNAVKFLYTLSLLEQNGSLPDITPEVAKNMGNVQNADYRNWLKATRKVMVDQFTGNTNTAALINRTIDTGASLFSNIDMGALSGPGYSPELRKALTPQTTPDGT